MVNATPLLRVPDDDLAALRHFRDGLFAKRPKDVMLSYYTYSGSRSGKEKNQHAQMRDEINRASLATVVQAAIDPRARSLLLSRGFCETTPYTTQTHQVGVKLFRELDIAEALKHEASRERAKLFRRCLDPYAQHELFQVLVGELARRMDGGATKLELTPILAAMFVPTIAAHLRGEGFDLDYFAGPRLRDLAKDSRFIASEVAMMHAYSGSSDKALDFWDAACVDVGEGAHVLAYIVVGERSTRTNRLAADLLEGKLPHELRDRRFLAKVAKHLRWRCDTHCDNLGLGLVSLCIIEAMLCLEPIGTDAMKSLRLAERHLIQTRKGWWADLPPRARQRFGLVIERLEGLLAAGVDTPAAVN